METSGASGAAGFLGGRGVDSRHQREAGGASLSLLPLITGFLIKITRAVSTRTQAHVFTFLHDGNHMYKTSLPFFPTQTGELVLLRGSAFLLSEERRLGRGPAFPEAGGWWAGSFHLLMDHICSGVQVPPLARCGSHGRQ